MLAFAKQCVGALSDLVILVQTPMRVAVVFTGQTADSCLGESVIDSTIDGELLVRAATMLRFVGLELDLANVAVVVGSDGASF